MHTAYLVGRILHLPNGQVRRMPVRRALAKSTDLLGHSSRGWVFAAYDHFFLYTSGQKIRVGDRDVDDLYTSEMLSSDGRQIVASVSGQADDLLVHLIGLDGSQQNLFTVNAGTPSAAEVDRVFVAGSTGIDELVAGQPRHRVWWRPPALVDLDQQIAYVGRTRDALRTGPAPFDPDTGRPTLTGLAWTARFHPVRISADGRRVLGQGKDGLIQVRRMSDGAVLASFPPPGHTGYHPVVGWNGSRSDSIVYVVDLGHKHALVRCAVAPGRCTPVTSPTAAAISLPTAVAGVRVYP